MRETTPNLELVKPGENGTADIKVIDENMGKIDTAIGKPSTLKTIKKVITEAINELHSGLNDVLTESEVSVIIEQERSDQIGELT